MRKALFLVASLAIGLAAPGAAQYNDPRYGGGPHYGEPGDRGPDRGPDGGPDRGPPRAILFGQPGFQGRRVMIDHPVGKLDHLGFDDRAQSIMVRGGGAWRVCEDDHFGGRCEIIDRPIPDLTELRLNRQISSIAPVGPGPRGY